LKLKVEIRRLKNERPKQTKENAAKPPTQQPGFFRK
jgi:hypothetical protein